MGLFTLEFAANCSLVQYTCCEQGFRVCGWVGVRAGEQMSEYCKLTTGRSHLRSANQCLLSVPRTRTTNGDRSFAVSGPVAWNSLPVAMRSSDVTEETFRRHLNTFCLTVLTISYVDSYRYIDSYVTILPSVPTAHLWPLQTCAI